VQHTKTLPASSNLTIAFIAGLCIHFKGYVKSGTKLIRAFYSEKLEIFLHRDSDWPAVTTGIAAATALALKVFIVFGNYVFHPLAPVLFSLRFLKKNLI
jgi:hypothetical protein